MKAAKPGIEFTRHVQDKIYTASVLIQFLHLVTHPDMDMTYTQFDQKDKVH